MIHGHGCSPPKYLAVLLEEGMLPKKNDANLRILPALIFQQTDIFSATDMKQQTWDCITASHNYDCEAGKGHRGFFAAIDTFLLDGNLQHVC